jgi:cell wall-associated NlpC family hydrolase
MSNKFVIPVIAVLVIAVAGSYLLLASNLSSHAATSTSSTLTKSTLVTTTTTVSTTVATTTIKLVYNVTDILGNNAPTNPLIKVAIANYKAPYCQGSSQAPVGSNGIPCALEVNSSAKTFNSTSGAFDCAGFIQYVYSQVGVKLPVTAQAQFGNFYPADDKVVPVPGGQANTIPGDLVYFSIPGDQDPEPAHVAMCFVAGCNIIIQDGGPPPGWPGTIANLSAQLCTNETANQARCVMGFSEISGYKYQNTP